MDGKGICYIHPAGVDYTVREMEKFDRAVDDGEAEGYEGIDGTGD